MRSPDGDPLLAPRDLLDGAATAWPDDVAYVDARRRVTWGQLAERSWRLAGGLAELGVEKGDVVASLSDDGIETLEHFWACALLGAVRTGINFRYAEREIGHLVDDADAKVLLVDAENAARRPALLERWSAEDRRVVGIGPDHPLELDYETLVRAEPVSALPRLTPDDAFALSYTSGTTGLPKGAIFTQRSVRDALIWSIVGVGLRHEDVWVNPVPGPGAPIVFSAMGVVCGMRVVLPGSRFDASRLLDWIERERVTAGIVVPTMLSRLVAEPSLSERDLSSLRLLCYGSSPAAPALIRAAVDRFGCEMQQWYTCTELTACPSVILNAADHRRAISGRPELLACCGRPLGHVRLRILDEAGRDLPAGEIGQVAVLSATVFDGYRNRPQETADALSGEGWLRTGDLGLLEDDGYLRLVDRRHFMIISGGYNVYPVVVESVLADHPSVDEVAVVGVPHPEWGEAVVALASARDGRVLDPGGLIEWCRTRVGAWEVPKAVRIVDELPKGATQKIDKRTIREQFAGMFVAGGTERRV